MYDRPSMLTLLLRAFDEGMKERCNLFRRHSWESTAPFKRRCTHCGEEQWLFSKQYPAIGEAKYTWEKMSL